PDTGLRAGYWRHSFAWLPLVLALLGVAVMHCIIGADVIARRTGAAGTLLAIVMLLIGRMRIVLGLGDIGLVAHGGGSSRKRNTHHQSEVPPRGAIVSPCRPKSGPHRPRRDPTGRRSRCPGLLR